MPIGRQFPVSKLYLKLLNYHVNFFLPNAADLDVIEMNFQGDEIDCWMSIQEGKGPWAKEVSRIVPVGEHTYIYIFSQHI